MPCLYDPYKLLSFGPFGSLYLSMHSLIAESSLTQTFNASIRYWPGSPISLCSHCGSSSYCSRLPEVYRGQKVTGALKTDLACSQRSDVGSISIQLNALPTVGYSGIFSSYITAIQWLWKAAELLQEGYDRVCEISAISLHRSTASL